MDSSKGKLIARSSKYHGVHKANKKDVYLAYLSKYGLIQDQGQRIYLGSFENEEDAARTYDLVSLKYWGIKALTNFPLDEYKEEIPMVVHMTDEQILTYVRSGRFVKDKSVSDEDARQVDTGEGQENKGKGKEGAYVETIDTEATSTAIALDVTPISALRLEEATSPGRNPHFIESISEGKVVLVEEEIAKEMEATPSKLGTSKEKRGSNKKIEARHQSPNPNFEKEAENGDKSNLRFATGTIDWFREKMAMVGMKDSSERSTTLGFRDSSSSPIQAYEPTQGYQHSSSSASQAYNPAQGYQHSSSSAFQAYNPTLGYQHPSAFQVYDPTHGYLLSSSNAFQAYNPNLGYQHSSYSPFQAYKSALGFRHSSSSPFQAYKPVQQEEMRKVKKVIAIRPSVHAPTMKEIGFSAFQVHNPTLRFRHSSSSSFQPYKLVQQEEMREVKTVIAIRPSVQAPMMNEIGFSAFQVRNPTLGFRHSCTSPFQPYKPSVRHEEVCEVKKVIALRPSYRALVMDETELFHFQTNRNGEGGGRGAGNGFRHSSSSGFKPYHVKK